MNIPFGSFNLLLLDIDGLRPDVIAAALEGGQLPNIERLFGGRGLPKGIHVPILAPAPSITFCSQASLYTGEHPRRHGIPGNQFYDRFGTYTNGKPRHFAFDVGDTLAVDDAVRVFVEGLASDHLTSSTIYEKLARRGMTAVVAGNMYAAGARTWLKPDLTKIARYTKGGNLFGMSSATYDGHVLNKLIKHISKNGLPEIMTMYFMGLDHDSHKYGPDSAQSEYLVHHVDPMIGDLLQAVQSSSDAEELPPNLFVALFSDHGQIRVVPDDKHSLRIGFPFDREMGHLFSALGLDVHDFPGEDPNCDALMALNGGLAFVYLQNRTGHWADAPDFARDVLPVARAFWEAHETGKYAEELLNALAGVLVRNVDAEGWEAQYRAITPGGELVSLEEWFASQPEDLYADPVHRLNNLAGLYTGDILLISNYAEGYYFGGEITGIHGGLHPEDSNATLYYGWPGASETMWAEASAAIRTAIAGRCAQEGGRAPSVVDMVTGLEVLFST